MKKIILFSLLIGFSLLLALSEVGEKCSLSGDCIEGYCENGVCTLPNMELIENKTYIVVGICNITDNCTRGFCYEGECVYPLKEEYVIFTPGIKSGCAGIIENCVGFWCMFCNVTWILLVVGALSAAVISRKKGRILPFLMFLIPVTSGLVIFPIFGFILSLIEIFIISLKR
jgi:hypothetical protein